MKTASAKRKNDAVITVIQDNDSKKIEIKGANLAAEKLTGYNQNELIDLNINSILPNRIKDAAKDIEFDDFGDDISSVFRKIPDFHIVNKSGKETPVSVKIFPTILMESPYPAYELLMRDITLIKHIEELKQRVSQARAEGGHIDDETGLSDIEAVKEALHVVYQFVLDYGIEASFVLASVDKIGSLDKNYGYEATNEIISYVGTVAKQTCREDDVVGHLGGGNLAFVLLDCNTNDAKSVLNRFLKNLKSKSIPLLSGQNVKATASIVAAEIGRNANLNELIDNCRMELAGLQQSGGNGVRVVTD